MSGQWPKFIRDPIHDLIRFEDTPQDKLLLDLINCKEFQRLRRIKQLGFSDMVFPGATHTRFAHSIGVMWNAKRLLNHISSLDGSLVPEEHRLVVVVAALLHDLGHGPFSHAFEKITKIKHERKTVEIILRSDCEIHQTLFKHDRTLPSRVASLFDEGDYLIDETSLGDYQCPQYLRDVVSSQLDADRWDYLVRDSHHTGTEYGHFDVNWLVSHIYVDTSTSHDRLYLSRKAYQAVEGYVFARYHMYQSVYFHKATRASEVMLRLLFNRYKELLQQKDTDRKRRNVVCEAPHVVVQAFSGEIQLTDYLSLDDHAITQFLKAASNAKDKTLRYLALGLLNRQLYKCVDASDAGQSSVGEFTAAVSANLPKISSISPVQNDCILPNDEPSDTPYRIYDPDSENPATQIYVQRETGDIVELSQSSKLVGSLKEKINLLRYYFPLEIRDKIDPIAEKHLKG